MLVIFFSEIKKSVETLKCFYRKAYLRMIFLVLLCDFNAQFSKMHQLIKSNFRVGQIILIFRKVVI